MSDSSDSATRATAAPFRRCRVCRDLIRMVNIGNHWFFAVHARVADGQLVDCTGSSRAVDRP